MARISYLDLSMANCWDSDGEEEEWRKVHAYEGTVQGRFLNEDWTKFYRRRWRAKEAQKDWGFRHFKYFHRGIEMVRASRDRQKTLL
jgi:hypothetical protein